MNYFRYRNETLHCESVSLAKIAREVGTPFYAYSHGALMHQFGRYEEAFANFPHLICFAVKANSNGAILRAIAKRGGGADIVTGGEIYRCIKAKISPKKIVFSGVGKSREEIEYALRQGILMFNVESAGELAEIDRMAKRMRRKAPISLRVNPNIDPKTHPYIATGLKKSKFGIPVSNALKLYGDKRYKNIVFCGISCHIGSQIIEMDPFVEAADCLARIVKRLRKQGIAIQYVDIGGGLGITYHKERPPTPEVYVQATKAHLKDLGATIIVEPGRSIVGNAGALITKVQYNKHQGKKKFVVVDAAMTDLARPSLYGSYHEIKPVRRVRRKKGPVDVVGPICESGDFLAQDRVLPSLKTGEFLAVMSSGAYGFSMASNYNSRPRIVEVLVQGKEYFIIRERESYKDLTRGENIPGFLV